VTTKRVVDHLASTAVSAVRHPIATAGYAAGLAKGATEATVSLVRQLRGGTPAAPSAPVAVPPETEGRETPTGERTMFGGLNKEAAPPRMPGGGGEAFEHHPSPENRAAGHGAGPADPREEASWAEEVAEETDLASEVPEPAEAEPLLDPGTAKAVRSETEILRKVADPDKG